MMSFSIQAHELKLFSWNTFMLPKPVKFTNQIVRKKAIAQALQNTDYDFIFLQEAFSGAFKRHLTKKLKAKYPFQKYLSNHRIIIPYFGSGVFVMGKHPFTVIDKVYFNKCKVADCYAAKGAILIESKLPSGLKVQFAVTHMQADERMGYIRLLQLKQIKEMFQKHKEDGVPQLLIGDLNIDRDEPEFQQGQELMNMTATQLVGNLDYTTVIDCYRREDHPREWIDHMWVNNDSVMNKATLKAKSIQYTHNGNTCEASDHYSVEGFFDFE